MSERLKSNFNRGIEKIIELMDYEVFIITANKNKKCICHHQGTTQPDSNCPRCLGTGYQITIQKTLCASAETTSPNVMRTTTSFVVARDYYIKANINLNNDDIIIDNGRVYFVVQSTMYSSFDGKPIYKKYTCVDKKSDTVKLLKNFYSIIGEAST